jgi:acetolactate synthase-1/3 small subunit
LRISLDSPFDQRQPRGEAMVHAARAFGPEFMRHIISILVENEFGALGRIAGLFTARGYNIECLTVAPTDDPTLSRMTLVTIGDDRIIEQIIKQLNKLLDVVKVLDITDSTHIEREMMLVKVQATSADAREEFKRLADIFRGRILDVTEKTYTIELTGVSSKLDAFLEVIGRKTPLEVVRSGVIGIARGDRQMRV